MGTRGLSRCPIELPSGDRLLMQPKAVHCRNSSKDCFWPKPDLTTGEYSTTKLTVETVP